MRWLLEFLALLTLMPFFIQTLLSAHENTLLSSKYHYICNANGNMIFDELKAPECQYNSVTLQKDTTDLWKKVTCLPAEAAEATPPNKSECDSTDTNGDATSLATDNSHDSNKDSNRYLFNGKEKQVTGAVGFLDYGARMYDPEIGRWFGPDKLAEDYCSLSPYCFTVNSPVNYIDPDGQSIYMLFYAADNQMFKATAETRKGEIEGMNGFNPEIDIVLMYEFRDLGQIGGSVGQAIDAYSKQYGKTAEVGIWSHAGWDGPIGEIPTSGDYALPHNQMSLQGWNDINFNWENDNANLSFYGCNTGNEVRKDRWVGSFARNLSDQSNFNGVNVWGQQTSSFPSMSPYVRATNFARTAGYGYGVGKTYMVGGYPRQGAQSHWFMPGDYPSANPMNVYQNGRLIRTAFSNR